MPTTHTRTAVTTDSINLIDKNNTGGLFLGLFKHIPYPGGTHTYKHFYKVRARDGKERHLGLTGNRFSQQGFTSTRLTHHQYTTGYTATQTLKPTRITQELHQLLYIFLGFIDTRHIRKSGFNLVFIQQTGLALTKSHGTTTTAAATLHLAHKKHKHSNNNKNRETGDQQLSPDTLLFRPAPFNFDLMLDQVVN